MGLRLLLLVVILPLPIWAIEIESPFGPRSREHKNFLEEVEGLRSELKKKHLTEKGLFWELGDAKFYRRLAAQALLRQHLDLSSPYLVSDEILSILENYKSVFENPEIVDRIPNTVGNLPKYITNRVGEYLFLSRIKREEFRKQAAYEPLNRANPFLEKLNKLFNAEPEFQRVMSRYPSLVNELAAYKSASLAELAAALPGIFKRAEPFWSGLLAGRVFFADYAPYPWKPRRPHIWLIVETFEPGYNVWPPLRIACTFYNASEWNCLHLSDESRGIVFDADLSTDRLLGLVDERTEMAKRQTDNYRFELGTVYGLPNAVTGTTELFYQVFHYGPDSKLKTYTGQNPDAYLGRYSMPRPHNIQYNYNSLLDEIAYRFHSEPAKIKNHPMQKSVDQFLADYKTFQKEVSSTDDLTIRYSPFSNFFRYKLSSK